MLEYLLRCMVPRLIHHIPVRLARLCVRISRAAEDRWHHDPQPRHQKRISGIAVIEKAERLVLKALIFDLVREYDLPAAVSRLNRSSEYQVFTKDLCLPHLPGHQNLILPVLPERVHGDLFRGSCSHPSVNRIFHTVHHPVSVDVSKTAGEHRAAHDGAHRLVPRGIVGIPPLKSRLCEET